MPDALSAERWDGIRLLCQGQPPTHERVARANGIGVKTLSRRAAQEKWRTLDFRFKRVRAAWNYTMELAARAAAGEELDTDAPIPDEPFEMPQPEIFDPRDEEDPEARIARIGSILAFRAEAMLKGAAAGRPLEGRQISALASLVQLSERIATMAREQARNNAVKSDEELGEIYRRIDLRIVELATEEARRVLVEVFGMPADEVDARMPWKNVLKAPHEED